MKTAVCELESISPYSQSRFHDEPKLPKELPNDYERRTWRLRMHDDGKGHVIIPPMAFKNCLSEAAKFLSLQIPGKGKMTWTKHFEAGVLVVEGVRLPDKIADVAEEWLFVPSDGKRGGSRRVKRCFGVIPKWTGTVMFHIVDDQITEEAFRYHLEQAGSLVGIGRFRPRNNGFYGRFLVRKIDWKEA